MQTTRFSPFLMRLRPHQNDSPFADYIILKTLSRFSSTIMIFGACSIDMQSGQGTKIAQFGRPFLIRACLVMIRGYLVTEKHILGSNSISKHASRMWLRLCNELEQKRSERASIAPLWSLQHQLEDENPMTGTDVLHRKLSDVNRI